MAIISSGGIIQVVRWDSAAVTNVTSANSEVAVAARLHCQLSCSHVQLELESVAYYFYYYYYYDIAPLTHPPIHKP